jgi:D-alanine-D-alanine ligase
MNSASPLASDLAILFGGSGSERFVSVATAQEFCTHLPEAELWFLGEDESCTAVAPAILLAHSRPFDQPFRPASPRFCSSVEQMLQAARERSLLLVLGLHGGEGEDGRLAARCEELGIAFTGSGSRASRLAFDKVAAKEMADALGVSVLPSIVIGPEQSGGLPILTSWLEDYDGVVAKPVRDGSSHGLRYLNSQSALAEFLGSIRDRDYLLEPQARGSEATAGVMDCATGPHALEPVEIKLPEDTKFDYTSKYLDSRVQEICPPNFPQSIIEQLKSAAAKVHVAIGAEGYSRSDFIVQGDTPIFLEINTLPGMTKASLFPRELLVEGISMRDFLLRQIEMAQHRAARALSSNSAS